MKIVGVLLAGGVGSRFWPISRRDRPKQFLPYFDGRSFLRCAADRLKNALARVSDGAVEIFVVTHERYADLAKGEVPEAIILAEKEARNTAPAIALAVAEAISRDVQLMLVTPSDHVFENEEVFVSRLKVGAQEAVSTDSLIVFGYEPLYAHTGYGYIEIREDYQHAIGGYSVPVLRFHEKPDLQSARSYLESGRFLWNMGVFCWSINAILGALRESLPGVYECVLNLASALRDGRVEAVYEELLRVPPVSIDKALFEVAKNVRVVPVPKCGWSDIGNLAVWIDLVQGNGRSSSEGIQLDCEGVKVFADKGLVVTLGVNDLIVVKKDEVVLVCDVNRLQDVSSVPKVLEERGLNQFL